MKASPIRLATAAMFALTWLIVGLISCGSSDAGTDPKTQTQSASAITITNAGDQIANGSVTLVIGDSTHLAGTPVNASGNAITGADVQWSVADTTIASISSNGLLRGLRTGTTSVIAKVDTASATIAVVIIVPPVAAIRLSLASSSIPVGQTTQATASLSDANGNLLTGRTVTFGSSDPTVATVAANGLVTAVKPGTTTMTANSESVSATIQLQVVAPIPGVPARIAAQSWSIISAPATTTLASAPSVIVLDGLGQPIANVNVTFTVTAGGGTLVTSGGGGASTSATVTTNSSGAATSPFWKLGSDAGLNSVSATVTGVAPITFVVTATPYTAFKIELAGPHDTTYSTDTAAVAVCLIGSVLGSGQGPGGGGRGVRSVIAAYGDNLHAALSLSIVALPCDANRWFALLPLGSVTAGTLVPIVVTAVDTAGDSASVSTAVIYKPGPVAITLWASPPSSAPAGTIVQVSVQVVDANSSGIPNVPVTFTVTGGGSVGATTVISGVSGITTTNWTLGSTPGTNVITATAAGTTTFTYTVEGTPP